MRIRVAVVVGALLGTASPLLWAAKKPSVSLIRTSSTELPKDGIGGDTGAMIDKGPLVIIGATYKPEKGGEASLFTRTDDTCLAKGDKPWAVVKPGAAWKGEHVIKQGEFLCVLHAHNQGTAVLTWDTRGDPGGAK